MKSCPILGLEAPNFIYAKEKDLFRSGEAREIMCPYLNSLILIMGISLLPFKFKRIDAVEARSHSSPFTGIQA
ncbi:hypothetical protein [Halotia branconii]|uniref:Uncharacterized protein n=1 Tax=Halotia branconii CENA392 TaxID=1539056 RepID=A0AAJ6P9L5_9CYAN|nr:hypothetical protein [Halotia branconii]WGV25812.1 hypothetical protein QI031_29535 [Halotia branconii CENA392]